MPNLYHSVTAPLRPVYAGYFPRFNSSEIESRVEYLEPHMATQLNPYNIITYSRLYGWRWFEKYLQQDPMRRKSALLEVLEYVGFSSPTVTAMGVVDRLNYCPIDLRPLSYLNWSIPLVRGSCLSAPGMVAIICDLIPKDLEGVAVEVGLGSGYHSLVMVQRNKGLHIIGYEPVAALYKMAVAAFSENDCGAVEVVNAPWTEETAAPKELAFAFQTNVNCDGYYKNIFNNLVDEGMYILPRPLTRAEFETRPIDKWLYRISPTYRDYLAKGYRQACALVRIRKFAEVPLEDQKLYSVTFVSDRKTQILDDSPSSNIGLKTLMDEFLACK